jgi:hypothetical protein
VVGFETLNDVLRRLLLASSEAQDGAGESNASGGRTLPGKLQMLLDTGAIKPGDRLVHRQVRKGRSFSAVVEEDGCIRDRSRSVPRAVAGPV